MPFLEKESITQTAHRRPLWEPPNTQLARNKVPRNFEIQEGGGGGCVHTMIYNIFYVNIYKCKCLLYMCVLYIFILYMI